jgi:hypothetical protein
MKVSCESYPPQLQDPRKTEEEVHLPRHPCSHNRLECFALENYTFLTRETSRLRTNHYAGSAEAKWAGFSNTVLVGPNWQGSQDRSLQTALPPIGSSGG